MAAPMATRDGMNWLTANGFVGDDCIEPEDVSPALMTDIFEAAAFRFNPAWVCALREHYEKNLR